MVLPASQHFMLILTQSSSLWSKGIAAAWKTKMAAWQHWPRTVLMHWALFGTVLVPWALFGTVLELWLHLTLYEPWLCLVRCGIVRILLAGGLMY
jgi:hypothetical protein